jgi:hypothetical protein
MKCGWPFFLGRENPVGVGYAGVEVLGGCNCVRHKGGPIVVKKPKPSCGGLVLANEMQGSLDLHSGVVIGVG